MKNSRSKLPAPTARSVIPQRRPTPIRQTPVSGAGRPIPRQAVDAIPTPTRPETPRPPTPSVTPPRTTIDRNSSPYTTDPFRPLPRPMPSAPNVIPRTIPTGPSGPLPATPMPSAPMPTRSLGSGPAAPVNMGKLNQVNSMVAGRPSPTPARPSPTPMSPMKKGGSVNSSASKRADGIATRGKTKGKMC
jgi:hypothetical protein